MSKRKWVAMAMFSMVAACSGPDGDGMDASVAPCVSDEDCDDAVFCNGSERCSPDSPSASPNGCVPGDAPCADCDELADRCTSGCDDPDVDGDGHPSTECGGNDCDDSDPLRFPGNAEVCDVDDHDEDCDSTTFGIRDDDGDGEPSDACCNEASDGTRSCGTDCDDSRSSVSPLLAETCDSLDNDCDGSVDEGVLETFVVDMDEDGHGSDAAGAPTMEACARPTGYASSADDCDDGNGAVNPGTPEICDEAGVDENCDGDANPATLCMCDFAGSRSCTELELYGRCAGGNYSCVMGTPTMCSIMPGVEVCDAAMVDEDCDGLVNEGVTIDCYPDEDNDGYAALGATLMPVCESSRPGFGGCPAFTTNREPVAGAIDCNDGNPGFSPDIIEICDGQDQDCDGDSDETFTCEANVVRACDICGRGSTETCNATTCEWNDCVPLDDICNGCDDDVDGSVDETQYCAVGEPMDTAGATITCTTACGTTGTGNCTAMCGVPDVIAGSCQFDCGGSICRATEVCNYCDDDGDGSFYDDEGLATMTLQRSYRMMPEWWALGVEPAGDVTNGVDLLNQGPTGQASSLHSSTGAIRAGYGEMEFYAIANLSSAPGAQPADGWALSVVHASGSQLVGAPGGELGVPRDREGYAVEWRVYTGDDTDEVTLRHLNPTGADDAIRWTDTVPVEDAFDSNDSPDDKGLRLRIQPETPGTRARTEVRAYWVNSGIEHLVTWCGGHESDPGFTPCPVRIRPGDRLVMIVSAASGSLSMNVDNIRMRATGEDSCGG